MDPTLAALVAAGIISEADAERIERQLDPDAARAYAERLMGESFQRGLTQQQRRALELVQDTQGNPTEAQLARLWAGEDDLLWLSVGEDIRSIAIDRAISASMSYGPLGANSALNPDLWRVVNEDMLAWVDDYYVNPDAGNFGSIPNLNVTARTQFAQAFREWQRGEFATGGFAEGLPQLIQALEPTFGGARAEAIAATETTRIFSEAELVAGNANEFIVGWVYSTANDSRVSEFCIGAEGAIMLKGESVFSDGRGPSPRHVRCRSSISQISQGALDVLRERGVVRA